VVAFFGVFLNTPYDYCEGINHQPKAKTALFIEYESQEQQARHPDRIDENLAIVPQLFYGYLTFIIQYL
jgi:hypothetical protein